MRSIGPWGKTFFATLAVWALFTWPLPRHVAEGVPSSSQNIELHQMRSMMPGDPLQLLYHYWLFADMLGGGTPWFHNLYEFNTGADAATRSPDAMYLPFSLFYAAGQAVGGRAFGYNFALFLALWGSLGFTWALVRRFTRDPFVAAIATAAAMVLPYRWVNLLGGSPAGFGMMWLPLFLLGLDRAIRDERPSGGWLAGAALVFMSWCDTHGLFFLLLSSPFWGLLMLAAKPGFRWTDPRAWLRLLHAAWPIALLGLAAIGYNQYWHRNIETSGTAGGRTPAEVALFSPLPHGFLAWKLSGKDSHIYIGWPVLLMGFTGIVTVAGAALTRWREVRIRRQAVVLLLLLLAAGGVAALALGTNGPFEGRMLSAMRKLVPPYTMVRQPAKIFHLMPPLLALGLALGLEPLFARLAIGRPLLRTLAGWLLLGAVMADAKVQVRPTLTLLAPHQRAYEAVARDASREQRPARALVLPLWPGDSDTGSVYEYYASLYRVRMVNGYRPFVPTTYRREIFDRFELLNQGAMTDEQADDLLRRGVGALVFHEDLYPEKVAPFPAGVALARLARHPRLHLLTQDGAVWSFKILPSSTTHTTGAAPAAWPDPRKTALPAWQWEAGHELLTNGGAVSTDVPGLTAAYLPLTGAAVSLRRAIRPADPEGLGFQWMVQTRGGAVRAECLGDDNAVVATVDCPAAPVFRWQAIPFRVDGPATTGGVRLRLRTLDGPADVGRIYLSSGTPPAPAPGDTLEIAGADLFRAGCTRADRRSVLLRRDWEPEFPVLYGPRWPMPGGRYEADLVFTSEAPAGIGLGELHPDDGAASVPLIAGRTARLTFVHPDGRPMTLLLRYSRTADMEIVKLVLRRLD